MFLQVDGTAHASQAGGTNQIAAAQLPGYIDVHSRLYEWFRYFRHLTCGKACLLLSHNWYVQRLLLVGVRILS